VRAESLQTSYEGRAMIERYLVHYLDKAIVCLSRLTCFVV